ncbi:haspin protein kinase [Allomyces macrogynus ATCC 38327]|uniref:Haspin protein kinase n=1 Tax=Allomyces macrogynus (strain ATCC 38327) TaxID=578462 RepID=A0A0L0SG93_ALLM3|nr:haspin protein kinase [Allomyces macrogynus ATCC 38327]|eukprot:KNE61531.1 haspin protein kinase [Allomyces macrogynus ATCC 38327]
MGHTHQQGRLKLDETRARFGFKNLELLFPVDDDEIKGFPCMAFNRISDTVKFGVKVNLLEKKYPEAAHPSRIKVGLLKEFTKLALNGELPHVAWYFGDKDVRNSKKALMTFPLKRIQQRILKFCNIVLAEFVLGGSIKEWIQEADTMLEQWQYIVFAVVWTLVVLQDWYHFVHNDLHFGNVLIDMSIDPEDKTTVEYVLAFPDGTTRMYSVPNCGIIPKLWDYKFSSVYRNNPGVPANPFGQHKDNIPLRFNPYYDIHQFLVSLLDLDIPDEVHKLVLDMYPVEVIPEVVEDSSSCESGTSDSESSEWMDDDLDGSKVSMHSSYYDTDEDVISVDLEDAGQGPKDDSSSEDEGGFVIEDQLVNGAERIFNLPTPLYLMYHLFFEPYTKPSGNGSKISFRYALSSQEGIVRLLK